MADLFTGSAPPSVDTTKTTATTAPQYYTDYLSGLAGAGKTALNADPNSLVAGFDPMQTQAFGALPAAATSYQPQLASAQDTAATAASGATPQSIQSFMNPYTSNVVDEMARLQQQNIQRNLMPSLKAGFVGTGGLGGQRYANALGQTAADWQANLTGQQGAALEKGYSGALQAALQQAQQQAQAAQVQGQLATTEQNLGLAGNKALQEAGAQKQAYEQSKINAPLVQASNVSKLLQGQTIPTTSSETYHGPWTTYQPSALSQIAGLGTLFASGANGTSAATGVMNAFSPLFSGLGSAATNAWDSFLNPITVDTDGLGMGDIGVDTGDYGGAGGVSIR
jgi:hypothetical protein